MAVDATSTALLNEIRNPSVTTRAALVTALRSYRPAVLRLSQQASVLQQLLAEAEMAESNEIVAAKFETVAQRLRGLQRDHDSAEKALTVLWRTFEAFARDAADLASTIEAET